MRKLYLSILTLLIVGATLGAFMFVKIPYPTTVFQLDFSYNGQYRIFDLKEHLSKYEQVKSTIQADRQGLAYKFQKADKSTQTKQLSQARAYLFETITRKIVPYWIETEWDFNGTTEEPRKGAIACGYFVSTILLHAGIDLDKYYLSREASSVLIRHLCQRETIRTIGNNDFKKFYRYILRQQDGLYIVGLETHVGLIEKRGNDILFIHSRKPRQVGVIREKALYSSSLQKSKIYVIGNLLDNEQLLRKWLTPKQKII